jgi:hypothetical protein
MSSNLNSILLAACLTLVSCLAYSEVFKFKNACAVRPAHNAISWDVKCCFRFDKFLLSARVQCCD